MKKRAKKGVFWDFFGWFWERFWKLFWKFRTKACFKTQFWTPKFASKYPSGDTKCAQMWYDTPPPDAFNASLQAAATMWQPYGIHPKSIIHSPVIHSKLIAHNSSLIAHRSSPIPPPLKQKNPPPHRKWIFQSIILYIIYCVPSLCFSPAASW